MNTRIEIHTANNNNFVVSWSLIQFRWQKSIFVLVCVLSSCHHEGAPDDSSSVRDNSEQSAHVGQ